MICDGARPTAPSSTRNSALWEGDIDDVVWERIRGAALACPRLLIILRFGRRGMKLVALSAHNAPRSSR